MAEQIKMLDLSPDDELRFSGPEDGEVSTNLRILNITDRRVAFKIKTTEPKVYIVQPSCGVLDSHSEVSLIISVVDRRKHKFMVQSMHLPGDKGQVLDKEDQEAMWNDAKPDEIQETKLTCEIVHKQDEQEKSKDVEQTTSPGHHSMSSSGSSNTTEQTKMLALSPKDQLRFVSPLKGDDASTSLRILNVTDKRVAFKMKTTAPNKYTVQPNCGVLNPHSEVSATIVLRGNCFITRDDPCKISYGRHKFMVQSMYIPGGKDEVLNKEQQEAMWKDAKPDEIQATKLKRAVEDCQLPA